MGWREMREKKAEEEAEDDDEEDEEEEEVVVQEAPVVKKVEKVVVERNIWTAVLPVEEERAGKVARMEGVGSPGAARNVWESKMEVDSEEEGEEEVEIPEILMGGDSDSDEEDE